MVYRRLDLVGDFCKFLRSRLTGNVCRCRYDRTAKLSYKLLTEVHHRDADAHCAVFCYRVEGKATAVSLRERPLGYARGDRRRTDDCARIDDGHRFVIHLNELNCHLRHLTNISAYHIHITRQEHQRLAVFTILDRIDLCNRLRVSRVTTDSPHCISRIKYHTTVTKHFKRLLNFCCHLIMLFLLLRDNGPRA